MDIVNDKNLMAFLNKKDIEVFNYYRQAPKDIQKMLKNIYSACYRFNLNNAQTMFMLREALKPFRNEILCSMFEKEE